MRGRETVAKIERGEDVAQNVALIEDLCEVMRDGSLCAMGGLTPMPVLSALRLFPRISTAPRARREIADGGARPSWIRAALAAALLFAAPLSKRLLGIVDPVLLAGLLYLGSGLGLALWRRASGQPAARLPRADSGPARRARSSRVAWSVRSC